MAVYHPTTRKSIADLGTGIKVQTGALAATTYLVHTAGQNELFTVKGAILVTQLYLEVTVAIGANACQATFNWTTTAPAAIGPTALATKCSSLSGLGAGQRIVYVGGAIGGSTILLTDGAGLSDITMISPVILGGIDFTSTIGMLASDATAASGSLVGYLHYYPYTNDAIVVAAA